MWLRLLGRLDKRNVFPVLGSLGFIHEVVVEDAERPFVLAACIAFAGLKWTLPVDDRVNGDKK